MADPNAGKKDGTVDEVEAAMAEFLGYHDAPLHRLPLKKTDPRIFSNVAVSPAAHVFSLLKSKGIEYTADSKDAVHTAKVVQIIDEEADKDRAFPKFAKDSAEGAAKKEQLRTAIIPFLCEADNPVKLAGKGYTVVLQHRATIT